MKCTARLALLCLLLFAWLSASADSFTFVTTQAALGANDQTTWGQLGPDGTPVLPGAVATSAGGNSVTLQFGGVSGLTSVQCPANPSCSWTGGFTPGETLIWTFDGSNGSGALLAF